MSRTVSFAELARLANGGSMMAACGMLGVHYYRYALSRRAYMAGRHSYRGSLGREWQNAYQPEVGKIVIIALQEHVVLEADDEQIMVAPTRVVTLDQLAA